MSLLTRTFTSTAIACAAFLASAAQADTSLPAFIAKSGAKVIQSVPAEGGMTAITVEKDGKQGVFFTSSDKQTVFFGAMYDATTGANISDKYVPSKELMGIQQAVVQAEALAARTPQPNVAIDEQISSKRMQENLQASEKDDVSLSEYLLSDKVQGIMEGSPSKDTSFVFFDPLCTFCHTLYETTRPFVKQGASIKWIPVNILSDDGIAMSVEAIKRGSKGIKDVAEGKLISSPLRTIPTPTSVERARIDQNTMFMYAMLQRMKVRVATPTIFYPESTTGKLGVAQADGSAPADQKFMNAAFGPKNK